MPIEARIAIFSVALFALLWYLRRHPQSIAARIACAWHGPYPVSGERKSSYYRRVAVFAAGWVVQFTVPALCGLAWVRFEPSAAGSMAFQLVFLFALPLGLGMAVLGGMLAWAVSLKAATLGPNPVFEVVPNLPDEAPD